jgi:hypothetical protein
MIPVLLDSRRVTKRPFLAHDGFDQRCAERLNLVVAVNVAVGNRRRSARAVRAHVLDRPAQQADQQDNSYPHTQPVGSCSSAELAPQSKRCILAH